MKISLTNYSAQTRKSVVNVLGLCAHQDGKNKVGNVGGQTCVYQRPRSTVLCLIDLPNKKRRRRLTNMNLPAEFVENSAKIFIYLHIQKC